MKQSFTQFPEKYTILMLTLKPCSLQDHVLLFQSSHINIFWVWLFGFFCITHDTKLNSISPSH